MTRLRDHPGNLEGLVHEAETRDNLTRFQLRTADDFTYFCYYAGNFRIDNGEYMEINFSCHYPLREQLREKNQVQGNKVFESPRLSGQPCPHPAKPMYIQVWEMKVYQRKGGELRHIYVRTPPRC